MSKSMELKRGQKQAASKAAVAKMSSIVCVRCAFGEVRSRNRSMQDCRRRSGMAVNYCSSAVQHALSASVFLRPSKRGENAHAASRKNSESAPQ